jgi:hypothetical protein
MTETEDERPEENSLRVALIEHTLEGLSRVVRKAHRAGVPEEAVVILGRKVVEFRWVDDDDEPLDDAGWESDDGEAEETDEPA